MSVRSKRLAGPTLVPAGTVVTLYTCPAGETAIVKCITIVNIGTTPTTSFLFINGSTALDEILEEAVPNATGVRLVNLFICLAPGDTLQTSASVGANVVISVHGAELQGVA